MPSCKWPGCRRSRKDKEKYHLFRAPLDHVLLEKWKKIIPKGKKEFTNKGWLCSRHFKAEDIERYFHHKVPDGSVWFLERERVLLKRDAVPCAPSTSQPDKKILYDAQKQEYILPTDDVKEEENISPVLQIKERPIVEHLEPLPDQNSDLFNDLKGRRQEVIRDSSWTTTVSNEFFGYLHWDSNFTVQKHVLVFKNLKIKVFFNGKESKMYENITVDSLQNLAIILHMVEDQS